MPDPGLGLTLPDIEAQVCQFSHGTDDKSVISDFEANMLERNIRNGLRTFYYPRQSNGTPYDWSFLHAPIVFTIEVGTADYEMPHDFGGFDGPLYHDPTDNIRVTVVKTTADQILMWRQLNVSLSLWPMYYAEAPRNKGGLSSSRWTLMVWPSPSATFVLHGMYRILPLAPNPTQIYPYGGPEHAETILEACLAQAELQIDGVPGAHDQAFQTCLATSLMMDQSMHAPSYLGYNGDSRHGGPNPLMREGRYFENFDNVTVGGIAYSG